MFYASFSPLTRNYGHCLSLLQSCSSMNQLVQIHAQLLRSHLFQDPFVASKVIEYCVVAVSGNLHYARNVFHQISQPNTFTWNTIIRGYASSPFPELSLYLFRQMIDSGSVPNSFTFPFVIKACAHLGALTEGKQIHGFMSRSGSACDVFSVNGLIHMYATCGEIDLARLLFDTCGIRDVVSWNSMLSGYVNCGLLGEARNLFDGMPERGIVSWNAMINGYTKCGKIDDARELFYQMPSRNVESWNTLITGYANCGFLEMSRKLFDEMPDRNTVSWSAIITAYAQGHQPNEALFLFEETKRAGVVPNWATIVSVLSACAQLGALEQGKRVHVYIDRSKMKVDSIIGTALIDMYSKCGCIENAFMIFDRLTSKDVFSWTAMIGGLALNGHGDKALELFGQMEIAGVKPNAITFMGVLCACSHRGFVHMGRHYFDAMRKKYEIKPQIEHYGCLIDSFGRAGLLEEALSLVQTMPMKPNAVLWGTLLGACWIYRNAEVAEIVVQHLVELTPTDGGVYVLLANIYATVGRWDDAKKVRTLMTSKGISKTPGQSLIEVGGIVHEFYVGDKSHPRSTEIYFMLDEIASRLKLVGYVPNTVPVLFDIEEEEKEHAVSYHSEKLAIAFGLISTKAGTTIRIVKNLRVCRDCHSAAKLISKVFNREIILRDRNVFHYFRDGFCSCKDYW
ncbi:pentatricopeptide repeat-containing protein At5g66520-like [Aristolochia californica]|uniref:pentatricopeptide repeat-containing protein At5g66520-like n=1 Tax=Aristolochia californica TaxID=171875 RepID=UPI0035DDF2F0